jgi:glycosyltransferase involved in cell wall biosynthesis
MRSGRIDRELKNFRAEVAVSFIVNESIYSTLKRTVPFVYTLRIHPGQACETLVDKLTCLLAFHGAKKMVFQTPDARDFFSRSIRDKSVVIANPLTRNLPDWKGVDRCEKTIITACRLTEQKNLPMLISAFAEFRKTHPEYTLKIYGDGELKEDMKQLARDKNVADSVLFPGYAKNIHEIMSCSGIFALTSDYEGLSNSMLEALAIGIPTVCTDCPPGGAKLYIEDGISGMLVPVGDTEALTEKLCRMADDPVLCEKMSENSRKIREELDVDKVLGQWEAVLQ